jgi:hypothetical protein
MNGLTPSYEPETGWVILDGRPGGPAGEAGLVPVAGVDLAFDRADGHLVRAVVDADSEPAAALLTRLFGPQATSVLRDAAEQAGPGPRPLSPEPGLGAALSSLARLDATRATSPVPGSSPWWAAEAAMLAEQAGLRERALAEARQAVRGLGRGRLTVPGRAARPALAAADIAAVEDPEGARRLRDSIVAASEPYRPRVLGLDVAAEVEGLEKDPVRLPGLHWVLDPGLVPAGLFRPGLSPHSDLLVRHDAGAGRVVVEVMLAAGADRTAVGLCQARLVDPVVRRVLARAGFERVGSRVRAELRLSFPLDERGETWIDVVEGPGRPVRSANAHRIRRALRWADVALRAERAPAGLAPQSAAEDWVALAALAWERCCRDWQAAGDLERSAAVLEPRVPLPGPACLAEILGE